MGDHMGIVNADGGTGRHTLVRRFASLGAAAATAATMLFVVVSNASAAPVAQFNIGSIVCPILLFLRAAFGPFFAGIFDSLLAAFGCVGPSGT